MQKTDWWSTFKSVLALLAVGWGVADLIARLATPYAIPLDIFLIIIGVLILIREHRKRQEKELEPTTNSKINSNVAKIETPEPPHRLPIYFDIAIFILCILMFFTAGFQIWIWAADKASFNVLGLFFFIVAYFIAPIVVAYDFAVIQRKHRKADKSEVYAETSFNYKADNIKTVFDKCYQMLIIMKAKPAIQMDADFDKPNEPKMMKCPIKHSYFTVTIKPIQDKLFEIHATSDSKRVEIRWDYGRNKKNIEIFQKLMLSESIEEAKDA